MGIPLSWTSFLGVAVIVAGAALYALRSLRPALARDYDIFFSAIALLCGGILFFHGWRQDPILQFSQFLMAGSAAFFAVEGIRLRSVATEQAKRNTPIVDDERPVSDRYYRAELDELPSIEDRASRRPRRIPGSRDIRPDDNYDEDIRRPSRTRDERLGPSSGDRSRRRRPKPEEPPAVVDEWDDDYSEDSRPSRRTSSPRSGNGRSSDSYSRSRRSRPPRDRQDVASSSRDSNADSSSDYVDYRPVDPVDEADNWGDY